MERFNQLLEEHHYLGSHHAVGERLHYMNPLTRPIYTQKDSGRAGPQLVNRWKLKSISFCTSAASGNRPVAHVLVKMATKELFATRLPL